MLGLWGSEAITMAFPHSCPNCGAALHPPRQRWKKRDLYEAIKPLRETGAAWDSIGAAIGISGERCRQVWQLFVVADGTKSADY